MCCLESCEKLPFGLRALKEISSQIDKYLVSLSSKTYVFEDKMTKLLVSLTSYFCLCDQGRLISAPTQSHQNFSLSPHMHFVNAVSLRKFADCKF